jgi:hypothetical protein
MSAAGAFASGPHGDGFRQKKEASGALDRDPTHAVRAGRRPDASGPPGAPKRRRSFPVATIGHVLRPASDPLPAGEPALRLAATSPLSELRARGSPVASRASPGSDRLGCGSAAAPAPPTRTTPSSAAPCRPAERSAPVETVRIARGRAMPARGSPSASLRSSGSRENRLTAHRRATLAGLATIRGHLPPVFPPPSPCSAGARPRAFGRSVGRLFARPRAIAYRLYDLTRPDERQQHSRRTGEISVHKISRSQHPIHADPQPYPHDDAALPCSARALTLAKAESKSVSRRDNFRFAARLERARRRS